MAAFRNEDNGTWYVMFRYTDWKGERKQKCKRGFTTRSRALEWEREFLQQKRADVDMTFESFAQLYAKDIQPRLKENTWLTKDSIIQKKILPYFAKRKLSEITAKDVIDWQNEMRTLKDTPVDLFQVLDADSSQQDAVLLAKKGVSFVLQGPPGTGKSQTITNIIAECLASGTKVLFVSEKMAALEVVRKRLTAVGLADFCLTLHSYKANKKDVLEQLSSVLNLSRQKANLSDEVFQKLDRLQEDKEKLNEYAEQIFAVVEPLGKTIYEVNGQLANLESYENLVFEILNVATTTPKQLNRYISLLTQFASTIGKMSGEYKANPWNDANINAVTNELSHNIGAYLPKMLPKIRNLSDVYDKMVCELALEHSSSYEGFNDICHILSLGAQSPKAPVEWILRDDITRLWAEIERFNALKKSYEENQRELSSKYDALFANDLQAVLCDPLQLIFSSQILEEIDKLNSLISNKYCYSIWQNGEYQGALSAIDDINQNISRITTMRNELLLKFEREILDFDYKSMLSRFKAEYTSIFKVFKRQYKIDKRSVQGLYKQIVKKVSDEDIVKTLTVLREIDEIKLWFEENTNRLARLFGDHYAGEKTDIDAISKRLKAYGCAR